MDRLDDEALWSWVDRGGEGLEDYLASYPEDMDRVADLQRRIGAFGGRPVDPKTIGPYRVIGRLGAGGAGVVYEAEDPAAAGRRVAVKVLVAGSAATERQVAMFEREAQALRALSHPAIARILDAGCTEPGQHWLAMELVDGVALDEYWRERGSTPRARLELLAAICAGVAHAHGQGLVHRDLKPSNILVEPAGSPRILDFGLVRAVRPGSFDTLTRTGVMVGTMQFMSPEQARGERGVDARSDVFSLGVLLHLAVYERLPRDLRELDLAETLRVLAAPIPCPKPGAGWPVATRWVLERALAPAAAGRYPDASALEADLRRLLSGKSVARAQGGRGRWSARGWVATALFLALVGLGAVAAWHGWAEPKAGSRSSAVTPGTATPSGDGASADAASSGAARQPGGAGVERKDAATPSPVATLLRNLRGSGFDKASPFDAIRWRGGLPLVSVDGAWWRLEAVDGVEASTLVRLARMTSGHAPWSKRFEEDLVELVARATMRPPKPNAQLRLRGGEGGRSVARSVRWDPGRRARLRQAHLRFPFEALRWNGNHPEVQLGAEDRVLTEDGGAVEGVSNLPSDRWWRLTHLADVPIAVVRRALVERLGIEWRMHFELVCDYALIDVGVEQTEALSGRLQAVDGARTIRVEFARTAARYERLTRSWRIDHRNEREVRSPATEGLALADRVRLDRRRWILMHDGAEHEVVSIDGVRVEELLGKARTWFPRSWFLRIHTHPMGILTRVTGQTHGPQLTCALKPVTGGETRITQLEATRDHWTRSLGELRARARSD